MRLVTDPHPLGFVCGGDTQFGQLLTSGCQPYVPRRDRTNSAAPTNECDYITSLASLSPGDSEQP